MLHLNPLFTTTTPTWFHGELEPFETQAVEHFDEAVAAYIMEEARGLDVRLAATGGRDIGFLWLPDPAAGEIKGVGWVAIVQHDPDLPFEDFIRGVSVAQRSFGTKILRNEVDPPELMDWGPTTVHALSVRNKKTGDEFHSNTLWVFPEGDNAYGVTIMVNDAELVEDSIRALANYVASLEVVQEDV